MQHSVKLPRDVLKLRCNGLFFCMCLVFCRDALCGGSNISSSVAGLAVSACGNGLSERLAAPIWVACVGMKIIWNANEALFCFLRTRRKILWKLLHFFSIWQLCVWLYVELDGGCHKGHCRPVDIGFSEFN